MEQSAEKTEAQLEEHTAKGEEQFPAAESEAERQQRAKHPGRALIIAGCLLIAAALALLGANALSAWRAERASQAALSALSAEMEEGATVIDPTRNMPTVIIDGVEYIGTLELPSLELELPVQAEWSYAALQKSPCRYAGSAYAGNMVLAAHNYPSHFGKLNSLKPGDQVVFTDVEGNRFQYRVAAVDVLEPTAIQEMVEPQGWDLTLFTCTLGGASRVTVRCTQI